VATIYISSTYTDLKIYRDAVYHSLRRMRHNVIAMEDYIATDQRPVDKCLSDVASCDLYIGIFGATVIFRMKGTPSTNLSQSWNTARQLRQINLA